MKLNKMKFIKSYESFKEQNKEALNEEFIGGLLKRLIPDWVKNITIKNKKRIDRSFEEYKKEYENISKDLLSILDSKDEIDKDKLSKVQSSLNKKKDLIAKKLNNKLKELTGDNEKSKTYADFKRNLIDLEMINSELEQYKQVDIESDYVEDLKRSSKEKEKNKKEKEEQLRKETASDARKEESKEIKSNDDLTPGDILIYRNSNDGRLIVKITDDGKIQRISNEVGNDEFSNEEGKADDKKDILSLFNKEEKTGEPFPDPHKGEFERLKRVSKKAKEKFS